MNSKNKKTSSYEFISRLSLQFTLSILVISTLITACASTDRKEESIHAILEKENELIEKLQAERAQLEITQAVSANKSLTKAEARLALALEELARANKTIRTRILKTNQKEVQIEKY